MSPDQPSGLVGPEAFRSLAALVDLRSRSPGFPAFVIETSKETIHVAANRVRPITARYGCSEMINEPQRLAKKAFAFVLSQDQQDDYSPEHRRPSAVSGSSRLTDSNQNSPDDRDDRHNGDDQTGAVVAVSEPLA